MLSFITILSLANATPLSLEDTLDLVATQNPEVQIARLSADKQNLERLQILSNLAPQIEIKASWLDFGEPLEVNLMGDGTQDIDCSAFEAFGMGDLCSSFSEPMLLREAKIYDGSVQALLPLSALYSIYSGYKAQEQLYEISELERQKKEQDIALSVIEIYLQALHLQKVIAFTVDTQKRLEANQQKISAFVAQGLLHSIEEQRIQKVVMELALSALRAQQGYDLLLLQLQLLTGSEIEPIPVTTVNPPIENLNISDNLTLKIAKKQQHAAKLGRNAAYGNLLPSVAILAAKTATQGQGTLTPTSQQYVGLAIQGNFNWGQKVLKTKQAQLDYQIATTALSLQQEALSLQQQAKKNEWLQAQQQEKIAELEVTISKENLRQQERKFDEQLITVSELLDAENELLKALLDLNQNKNNTLIKQAYFQQSFSAHTLEFER